MLFTIAVILLVLWLLGMVSGYTLGNFIYVLMVIALVLFVVGLVSGAGQSDASGVRHPGHERWVGRPSCWPVVNRGRPTMGLRTGIPRNS